ncbi:hypothetical protein HGRIS_012099 [Hohenbuehelia grisea]|uniref:F-box domain-containing protein n=1 Tax=Hohenbuehelia grisea TaxID=104357 RepID=A0ABR3IR99_9AGAR
MVGDVPFRDLSWRECGSLNMVPSNPNNIITRPDTFCFGSFVHDLPNFNETIILPLCTIVVDQPHLTMCFDAILPLCRLLAPRLFGDETTSATPSETTPLITTEVIDDLHETCTYSRLYQPSYLPKTLPDAPRTSGYFVVVTSDCDDKKPDYNDPLQIEPGFKADIPRHLRHPKRNGRVLNTLKIKENLSISYADLPADVLIPIFQLCGLIPQVLHSFNTPLSDVQFNGDRDYWKNFCRIANTCSMWRGVALTHFRPVPLQELWLTPADMPANVLRWIQRGETPGGVPLPLGLTVMANMGKVGPGHDEAVMLDTSVSKSFDMTDVKNLVIEKAFDFTNRAAVLAYLGRPAPNLQLLVLTGANKYDGLHFKGMQVVPVDLFQDKTPRLTHLTLRFCLFDKPSNLLSTVTHLRLQWGSTEQKIKEFYCTLAAAPNVEQLDLFDAIPSDLKVPTQHYSVDLPKLKRLRVVTNLHGVRILNFFLGTLSAPKTLDIQIASDMSLSTVHRRHFRLWACQIRRTWSRRMEEFKWWGVTQEAHSWSGLFLAEQGSAA